MELKLNEITNLNIMNMTSEEFVKFSQMGHNCTGCVFWIDKHFDPFGRSLERKPDF